MPQPHVAQKDPYPVDVQSGKVYFWCVCGQSAAQPFCDGAHKGSGFEPLRYQAEASKTVYFCGCKATATQPFCDGSHNRL